ncbi:MAG: PEP-CTERM sorting domain-containing protein [Akkermansiaceae bacterium]
MKITTYLTISLLTIAGSASAATTIAYEFNGATTEGWTGSGQISGLSTTGAVSGSENVLTSSDITGIDPMLNNAAGATLTPGETWSTFTARFRLLDANAGSPLAFVNSGTILIFNGNAGTNNSTAFATKSYNGNNALAGDVFNMTLTPEGSGEWQVVTVDFSNAPAFNSANISAIRFDPVGNDQVKNFEIDYIRLESVPEPSSTALLGLGLGGFLLRRRR